MDITQQDTQSKCTLFFPQLPDWEFKVKGSDYVKLLLLPIGCQHHFYFLMSVTTDVVK